LEFVVREREGVARKSPKKGDWNGVQTACKAIGVRHDTNRGNATPSGHGKDFKILQGHDKVDKDQWFTMAASRSVNTRQKTGSLNLLKPRTNLQVRSNFCSVRILDDWNAIAMEKKKKFALV
jgi:hypothetical protein